MYITILQLYLDTRYQRELFFLAGTQKADLSSQQVGPNHNVYIPFMTSLSRNHIVER
jgi:hypothetical protein